MSAYHHHNCPICRPVELPSYLDKYESYMKIIFNEIDSLSISYHNRHRLEQTIENVIREIYLSNKASDSYSTAQPDYYFQDKLAVLEKKYNGLLLDYEREMRLREELDKEKKLLQSKVLSLTELQQECVQRHVGHSRMNELYNEIDSFRTQNKQLLEEIRYLKARNCDSDSVKMQNQSFAEENRFLKIKNNESELVRIENKELVEENKVLREKVSRNEELNANNFNLHSELERKDKRIAQILQELEYYKDLHDNFKKEYMKDSSSITQKYEKVLQEKSRLEESLSDLKEKYRNLSRKYSSLSQDLGHNPNQDSNGFTFKPKKDPQDQSGEKKLKDLERRLNELKEKVEETPEKKAENNLRNSTPTTNPNMSGYNTWKSQKGEYKKEFEDNEYVEAGQDEGRKGKGKRKSRDFEEDDKNRRRKSEMTPSFSPYKKEFSPSRSGMRSVSRKLTGPEPGSCEICIRKHGLDWKGNRD